MRLEKLLLREVEVTISLSNSTDRDGYNTSEKVITLKDLSEYRQTNYTVPKDVTPSDIENEIIKRQNELESLKEKKQKLIQDMQTAIEKEKEAWLVTKEEERQAVQEIGHKTGYDTGLEKAKEEYSSALEKVNEITKSARTDYFETIAKHENAIIELAIATAEKITKQHLAESITGMAEMVKDAIDDLQKRSNISLFVSPNDYEHVLSRKEELEALLEEGEVISIYINERLNVGDCFIKHPYGQLNISVDVQLKQIKAALLEKISERQS